LQKFTCGVKHNFNTGVIVDSDDRKIYDWNCSTCGMERKTLTKEDLEEFKTLGKVNCPLLTYE